MSPFNENIPPRDPDELANAMLDEGLSVPEESLSPEERRRVAEFQWIHAMLQHVYGRGCPASRQAAEARVQRVMAAIRSLPGPPASRGTGPRRPNMENDRAFPRDAAAERGFFWEIVERPYESPPDTVHWDSGDTIQF